MRMKSYSLRKKSARVKMKRTKMILNRILYPPEWILFLVSIVSFTALIFVFVSEKTESVPAYLIYGMSAYSLVAICAIMPKVVRSIRARAKNNRIVKRIASSEITEKYLSDLAFRGTISIYQGIIVDFLYVIFRIAVGILYASVWFISMAVYYLVLGAIRTYLIICYKYRDPEREAVCYRNTAWLLFLLNIPMAGMIILMIRTDSGFFYPGYVIYLSALYTFYTMIMAVRNLVKFRRVGSPVLSAAKVLNLVAAMMSVLGLQTAMIAQFSANGENYRKMMNTITGGFVYGIVIIIAVDMLVRSQKYKQGMKQNEQE